MATRCSFLAGSAALSLSLSLREHQRALAQDATPEASPDVVEEIHPPQDLLPTDWGRFKCSQPILTRIKSGHRLTATATLRHDGRHWAVNHPGHRMGNDAIEQRGHHG